MIVDYKGALSFDEIDNMPVTRFLMYCPKIEGEAAGERTVKSLAEAFALMKEMEDV